MFEKDKRSADFKLIRTVNGRRQKPGDLDIQHALDASSSRISLEDLGRKGYSSVRVLDRDKIAVMIRQAVNEALEDHARTILAQERETIEEESHKKFEELLQKHQQQPAQPPMPPPTMYGYPGWMPPQQSQVPNNLADIIAEAVRKELGRSAPQTAPEGAAGKISELEMRLAQLMNQLNQVQQSAGRPSRSRGERKERVQRTEKQQTLLTDIFEQNIELQGLSTEA